MYRSIQTGINFFPKTYNYFASESKISENRKTTIEERRGQLKMEDTDPVILKIVIQEMLAYKPTRMTLDDRYLQLERILDAIDEARTMKNTDKLIHLCTTLAQALTSKPGMKNALLERLQSINLQIAALESNQTHLFKSKI